MTGETFVRIWPACTVLILLLTELAVPFGPLRRWLLAGPHVAAQSEQGPWYIDGGGKTAGPFPTPREAAGHLTLGERIRSTAGDLLECAWCTGAHVTFWSVLVFVPGSLWDRITWWGCLWFASSSSVVILDAVADH